MHCNHCSSIVSCCIVIGDVAPAFWVRKWEGGVAAHLKSWGQWWWQVSSLSGRRGTSVDMPGHRQSKGCMLMGWWHVIATVLSLLGCAEVVAGGWTLMVSGGGGCEGDRGVWVVVAVDDGWEGNCLFVGVMYGLFSANTAYAAQYKERMVAYMIYYVIAYVTGFSLYIRQALDPSLRHSARWRLAMTPALVTACQGHAPWTPWYTCFIPVLVHMFCPSTH